MLILWLLVGVVACAVGLIPVGAIILLGLAIFGIVRTVRKEYSAYNIEILLSELEPSFNECIRQKEEADESVKRWSEYVKKAEFVENYDKTSNS